MQIFLFLVLWLTVLLKKAHLKAACLLFVVVSFLQLVSVVSFCLTHPRNGVILPTDVQFNQ